MKTCILVADRSRARFLVTEKALETHPNKPPRLAELEALTNPEGELTGNQLFANTRSGSDRSPGGVRYEYDDHREDHRQENERRFAARIAAELREFVERESPKRLVVVAEPRMLGLLRAELGNGFPHDIRLIELAEDLSWHNLEHIRAVLAHHSAL